MVSAEWMNYLESVAGAEPAARRPSARPALQADGSGPRLRSMRPMFVRSCPACVPAAAAVGVAAQTRRSPPGSYLPVYPARSAHGTREAAASVLGPMSWSAPGSGLPRAGPGLARPRPRARAPGPCCQCTSDSREWGCPAGAWLPSGCGPGRRAMGPGGGGPWGPGVDPAETTYKWGHAEPLGSFKLAGPTALGVTRPDVRYHTAHRQAAHYAVPCAIIILPLCN